MKRKLVAIGVTRSDPTTFEPLLSTIEEGRYARVKILFAGVDRNSREEAIEQIKNSCGKNTKIEVEVDSFNEETKIRQKLEEKSYDIIFINGAGKRIRGNKHLPRTTTQIIQENIDKIRQRSPLAKIIAIHNRHSFEIETDLQTKFGIGQHITKKDMLSCETFGRLVTALLGQVLKQKIEAGALKEIVEITPFGSEVKKREGIVRGVFDKLASREREAQVDSEMDGRISVYDAHMVETGHFSAIVHAMTLMAEYIRIGNIVDLGSGTTKPVGRIVREHNMVKKAS
jgi:hypothetical protein